jgi:hypothetical protein
MAVIRGPISQIVDADIDDLTLARPPEKTFGHRPLEHGREKRDDIQTSQMRVLGERIKR